MLKNICVDSVSTASTSRIIFDCSLPDCVSLWYEIESCCSFLTSAFLSPVSAYLVANDLYLVYRCLASPSDKDHSSVNESVDPGTLSWEVSTTPVEINTMIDGHKLKPTATLKFDSTKVDAKKLAALEEILYGKDPSSAEADDGVEPRLPLPDEVIKIMTAEG